MAIYDPNYDLIAIGSGPAGRAAALQAAELGLRAAIVEQARGVGGASATSGTVPLHTVRAAIAELAGRPGFGSRRELTVDDLFWRTRQVVSHEQEAITDRLRHGGVHVIEGSASFLDAHTLEIRRGDVARNLNAEHIVIATGATWSRPQGVDFDARTVLLPDGIISAGHLPATLTVVGGGFVGLEVASLAVAVGIDVTLVERRHRVLGIADDEIVDELQYHLRGLGLELRLGAEAVAVERPAAGGAVTRLADGSELASEALLYAAGRRGATAGLALGAAGLETDERGRIAVDGDFRTAQPSIFAAGDVTGSPAREATAAEQGRRAALAAFGRAPAARPVPFALYTIPEVAFLGPTERDLAAGGISYVVGRARYRDLPRGEVAGDRAGLLKLLVDARTRRVLGVHVFGTLAAELVHLGQASMVAEQPVDRLAETVFNVPSFADAYRVAALDAVAALAAESSSAAA